MKGHPSVASPSSQCKTSLCAVYRYRVEPHPSSSRGRCFSVALHAPSLPVVCSQIRGLHRLIRQWRPLRALRTQCCFGWCGHSRAQPLHQLASCGSAVVCTARRDSSQHPGPSSAPASPPKYGPTSRGRRGRGAPARHRCASRHRRLGGRWTARSCERVFLLAAPRMPEIGQC